MRGREGLREGGQERGATRGIKFLGASFNAARPAATGQKEKFRILDGGNKNVK